MPAFDTASALAEFHLAVATHPDALTLATRRRLHAEEFGELLAAVRELGKVRALQLDDTEAREAVARELADLVYVLHGTALACGVDLDRALELVHSANMRKAGGPVDPSGKQLRPDGWQPPDMSGAIL